jgi:hypothetical protein
VQDVSEQRGGPQQLQAAFQPKNFEIGVHEKMNDYPLLGQTFFQDFTYTIDNGAHSIHFVKKRKAGGSAYADPSRDPNNVPFTRQGNEIVVNVSVNGRPTKMYFDTGATSCILSKEQVKQLGLTIHEDAELLSRWYCWLHSGQS